MISFSELKKSDKLINKANKIHFELLSFVQNELREKRKASKIIFSFSTQKIIEKNKNESSDNKLVHHINEEKTNDTSFNSNDDNDEQEESSSDISCEEESIIEL